MTLPQVPTLPLTSAALLIKAMGSYAEAQAAFQAKIDANAAIKARLDTEGYEASDVLAAMSNEDGSITLIVDDRA